MVIEKILKQLTPERIKKEVSLITNVKIPLELHKWIKEYEKVGERNAFIWSWAYWVAQLITLLEVPKKYKKSLFETKFLMIMLIVLLDDVSDKTKNKKLLEEILKIPFEEKYINYRNLNNKDRKYLKFTIELWHHIEKSFKKYPRHKEIEQILEYDIRQILNGIKYAYLVNKNLYLANEIEFRTYLSHNTPAIISYMIDLNCLPKLYTQKIGALRRAGWYIQIMARISNWISTWKREIKENDFASGIFCYAMENKNVKLNGLHKIREKKIIEKINKSGAEKYLLKKWEEHYNDLKKFVKKRFINHKEFLDTTKKLTVVHLISRGFI